MDKEPRECTPWTAMLAETDFRRVSHLLCGLLGRRLRAQVLMCPSRYQSQHLHSSLPCWREDEQVFWRSCTAQLRIRTACEQVQL